MRSCLGGHVTGISALYSEFTVALTEVLAKNAVLPARRGRLARARATVKKHPDYTESGYFLTVLAIGATLPLAR